MQKKSCATCFHFHGLPLNLGAALHPAVFSALGTEGLKLNTDNQRRAVEQEVQRPTPTLSGLVQSEPLLLHHF